jgi:DNA-binding transcriptional LysR family regulator
LSNVDLERLRVFAEVARQGSVTRAARRLRLQQPTVSHALAALERDVGTALLERLPKGVRLTAAGEALLPYARQVPGLADEAVRAAREAAGLAARRVTLGCAETPATYLLPRLLRALRTRHPEVEVTLEVGNAESMLGAVLEGTADLGLLSDREMHPLLAGDAILEDRFVAVVAPDDPWAARETATPVELAARRLLLRERGAGTRAFVDAMLRHAGLEPRDSWEVASVEALKRLAEAGVGVAIVPGIAVARERAAGHLHVLALDATDTAITYRCVRHRSRPTTPAMDQVAALFRQWSTLNPSG